MIDERAIGVIPLWVCYCGMIAQWSGSFPHWDCDGGRPLTEEELMQP
jgi:hypothetical protein